MEISIALFSMASPASVRSVSARFNDADPLKERVRTERTEGGEGMENGKSQTKK